MNATLHRSSVWQLVAYLFLAAAGLAGMIELQHALDDGHDHRAAECKLDRAVANVLIAVADDPTTSRSVRDAVLEVHPELSDAIAETCNP